MRLFILLAWAIFTASFSHQTKTLGHCSRGNSCSIVVLIVYNCYSSFLSHSLGCDMWHGFGYLLSHILGCDTFFLSFNSIKHKHRTNDHGHTRSYYAKFAHMNGHWKLEGLRYVLFYHLQSVSVLHIPSKPLNLIGLSHITMKTSLNITRTHIPSDHWIFVPRLRTVK